MRPKLHLTANSDFAQPQLPHGRPVRGMKLKTVSAFVLAFSLLCLAAFIAGHSPVPRPSKSRAADNERSSMNTSASAVRSHSATTATAR